MQRRSGMSYLTDYVHYQLAGVESQSEVLTTNGAAGVARQQWKCALVGDPLRRACRATEPLDEGVQRACREQSTLDLALIQLRYGVGNTLPC